MASFKKIKSGSYQAKIYTGRDSSGKQQFKYITKSTLKECKVAAHEYEVEMQSKSFVDMGNSRIVDFMEKWLELKTPHIADSTLISYRLYINKHFKPFFGTLRFSQVNEIYIKQYLADKLKEISNTTVRKHFFVLSEIFYDAMKRKSPCIDLNPPKPKPYTPKVPTEDEFSRLHEVVRGTRDELPILLAAWCGLRQGEIFALQWDDIDDEKNEIRIDESLGICENDAEDESMEKTKYIYKKKDPKSDNGKRIIAAPKYIFELIRALRVNQKAISNKLFTMRPDSYSKRFAKIVARKENNLPDIRFHDLRHYHATVLYKNNIPDQYASQRLGHDIMVLKKIYQHLQCDAKVEMDAKVKTLFG